MTIGYSYSILHFFSRNKTFFGIDQFWRKHISNVIFACLLVFLHFYYFVMVMVEHFSFPIAKKDGGSLDPHLPVDDSVISHRLATLTKETVLPKKNHFFYCWSLGKDKKTLNWFWEWQTFLWSLTFIENRMSKLVHLLALRKCKISFIQ